MIQFLVLCLATLVIAEIPFPEPPSLESFDSEPAQNMPEVDVKIIPTHIDIAKLREAYAKVSAGERFLPGPSRLPFEFFEQRRKRK
ncbi:unnamed protein product [Cylicocyclus nassatus]|uniref:Uncharacterized protein n=1 Tax=Cylicocyclus nassatus TaxID=53992 RepID=A0AA36M641_CYLNA|nr:unnamed protein product [Cylicocyclus nassatus]